MSEPFIAEIRIFAGNFAPRGWAFCNGGTLPIAQNTALFSLISTIYGGNGRTTMGIPDLQGRAPMHPGTGTGLSKRVLGQHGGNETYTLTDNHMPAHNHRLQVTLQSGSQDDPSPDEYIAAGPTAATLIYGPSTDSLDEKMAPNALPNAGGGQAHNKMPPFLAIHYIIALEGLYPSRG